MGGWIVEEIEMPRTLSQKTSKYQRNHGLHILGRNEQKVHIQKECHILQMLCSTATTNHYRSLDDSCRFAGRTLE